MVVDFDKLAQALGSSVSHAAEGAVAQAAFLARSAVIDALLDDPEPEAWIIHTSPKQEQLHRYREADAQLILLDPGIDTCLDRAKERPDGTADVIRAWYENPPQIDVPTNGTLRPKGGHMKFKNLPVKFKTEGLNEGEFLVYPSTFTRTPDSYGDVVAKGAFARGIVQRKELGAVLPGLFGHRMDDPHMWIASAIDEGEDEHGWWVKGVFDLEDATAAKVYRLVKSGRLRELSFAYDVLDGGLVKLEDGTDAYELRDLDVFEFSFVPVGANRDTSVVAVKSAADALAAAVKGGQLLGTDHTEILRDALGTLADAVDAIKNVLPQPGQANDQATSGGQADAKDEGADRVKSEGLGVNPTRRARANYLISLTL
ncbi:Putative prohead protease [Agrococcus casei LMG 22410]|uniref:Putative prohead protease n=1 Tax=Agrococcus casei LMG 22410 TaxID=1255656 RepID=A0A1R4FH95_9MICO|nr:Putative prohead protease [Agrococcus casei LMG 22410]